MQASPSDCLKSAPGVGITGTVRRVALLFQQMLRCCVDIAALQDFLTQWEFTLLNMGDEFAVKDDTVYVIEANPRASRTVPFIAKAYQEPYVQYATQVMLGEKKVADFDFQPRKRGYAIKIPVFSYSKFPEVNKELGPEMKSTGEAIQFIDTLRDPFFRKIYSERNLYLSK